jgi:hypothetical protein
MGLNENPYKNINLKDVVFERGELFLVFDE